MKHTRKGSTRYAPQIRSLHVALGRDSHLPRLGTEVRRVGTTVVGPVSEQCGEEIAAVRSAENPWEVVLIVATRRLITVCQIAIRFSVPIIRVL
jgi:hypothetical protein